MARAHMVWGTKEEKARMGTDYCYYRVVTAVNAGGWMSHQGSRKVPGFRLHAMISVKCRPEKRTLPWQSDPPLFSDRSSGRAAAAMGSAGVVHRPVVPVQCIEMYRSSQGDYVKVYSDHHNW